MSDFPTAREIGKQIMSKSNFDYWIAKIKQDILNAVEQEESCIYVELHDDHHLYDSLEDFLVEKGYQVEWNRACLWMEIRW